MIKTDAIFHKDNQYRKALPTITARQQQQPKSIGSNPRACQLSSVYRQLLTTESNPQTQTVSTQGPVHRYLSTVIFPAANDQRLSVNAHPSTFSYLYTHETNLPHRLPICTALYCLQQRQQKRFPASRHPHHHGRYHRGSIS